MKKIVDFLKKDWDFIKECAPRVSIIGFFVFAFGILKVATEKDIRIAYFFFGFGVLIFFLIMTLGIILYKNRHKIERFFDKISLS